MMQVMIGLCIVVSTVCAIMLLRGFAQRRIKLLFLVGMCFVGFAIENVLLFLDLIVLPKGVDISALRFVAALAGMVCLSFGLFEKVTEQ
ncbi:MAG TPA: DUF5985 family protein [Candidatus Obscuribacterales bacterium]